MDWSSRRIHQWRQGSESDHFLPCNHLRESTPRSGSMVPETADQIERGLFADHPRQLSLRHSPFPYHYPSYHHPPQDMRSRVLREMVRERIREEVLMSEVARRRALEAAVRYELMIEQRNSHGLLPLRSSPRRDFLCPLGLPLTRSGSSERRPFEEKTVMSCDGSKYQCENDLLPRVETDLRTSEEVKPTLPFLLPKPAVENLAGSKRKAPETPHGAETSGSCSKIKAKEAWSCALCLFSGTSKQGLEEHLRGEKHKANEEALRYESARKNHGAELQAQKETTEPIQKTLSAKALPLEKNETKEGLQSETSHKNGDPKDLKTNEAAGQPQNPEEDGDVMANDKGYKFWCEICGVGTFSQKVMNTHKAGRKHKRQVQSRDRTRRSLCMKNSALPAVNNQESIVAEDGSQSIADAIREEGEGQSKDDGATDLNVEKLKSEGDEVRAMGSELVDMIKEEDWWAFMVVASEENGLIDDAVKLST